MATHSSILAQRIPWTVQPSRLESMGLQRVGRDWALSTFIHGQLRRSPKVPSSDSQHSLGISLFPNFHSIYSVFMSPVALYGCSVQFSSVAQSCSTLFDPMNRSMPGLPVHHQLLEFTQTHVHRVSDAIQPCHPLSSPSPPALNPSQHQSLFQ